MTYLNGGRRSKLNLSRRFHVYHCFYKFKISIIIIFLDLPRATCSSFFTFPLFLIVEFPMGLTPADSSSPCQLTVGFGTLGALTLWTLHFPVNSALLYHSSQISNSLYLQFIWRRRLGRTGKLEVALSSLSSLRPAGRLSSFLALPPPTKFSDNILIFGFHSKR